MLRSIKKKKTHFIFNYIRCGILIIKSKKFFTILKISNIYPQHSKCLMTSKKNHLYYGPSYMVFQRSGIAMGFSFLKHVVVTCSCPHIAVVPMGQATWPSLTALTNVHVDHRPLIHAFHMKYHFSIL